MILTGFSGLDALTGGLQERKNYILYGDIGVGKTTFAFHFLYQGLLSGETVALVTRRSAQTVFDHGAAFGFDLESFAQSGSLIVFEYLPHVVENATRLRDEGQIFQEFKQLLKDDACQRLVLDPVTPLLATPSASAAIFRARTLVQTFAELETTGFYLFDTPEGEEYLANCKDFVYGVLRFEAAAAQGTRGRMVLERLPGLKGRPAQLEFEVTQGVGFVEAVASAAAPGQSAAPAGQRKVLIVVPDAEQREMLRSLLDKTYLVIEAEDGADGLAKVAAALPDLVVIEREIEGVDGVEFSRRLRQNKINVPIVLIANQIRRAHDRVAIIAAGADECLERPVDGRILKLKIQNLLRRYDGATDRFAMGSLETGVSVAMERDKTTATTNLAYFYDRVQKEASYTTDNALSFALVVMRQAEEVPPDPGLVTLAGSLIREYDIVYSGNRFVAILLAETDEKGVNVFLRRFAEQWKKTPAPAVRFKCFDRRADSFQAAKALIEAAAAGIMSTKAGGQAGRV